MERQIWDAATQCADCGTPLDEARQRGFRGHADWALCSGCALERGARFDEDEDCWIVPPGVTGLPILPEHRVR